MSYEGPERRDQCTLNAQQAIDLLKSTKENYVMTTGLVRDFAVHIAYQKQFNDMVKLMQDKQAQNERELLEYKKEQAQSQRELREKLDCVIAEMNSFRTSYEGKIRKYKFGAKIVAWLVTGIGLFVAWLFDLGNSVREFFRI